MGKRRERSESSDVRTVSSSSHSCCGPGVEVRLLPGVAGAAMRLGNVEVSLGGVGLRLGDIELMYGGVGLRLGENRPSLGDEEDIFPAGSGVALKLKMELL